MADIKLDSNKRNQASEWFKDLRNLICNSFEEIETEYHRNFPDTKLGKFQINKWQYQQGSGGGEAAVMKGSVFEKVGVNISNVDGIFNEEMRKQIPGTEKDPKFWASGISLVAHMKSPLVPSVHMNTRCISTTDKYWFGGGADLTPTIIYDKDTKDFHEAFKEPCEHYEKGAYEKFKKWCDEYFYIPHRKETRGVGGIFYDYIDKGDWEKEFTFTQNVGKAFAKIFPELVRRHMIHSWTKEQKHVQLIKRGKYAEFNLVYDRGTKFGLMTEGNIDAILVSLPPEAVWE